jgi:hypothetical protein
MHISSTQFGSLYNGSQTVNVNKQPANYGSFPEPSTTIHFSGTPPKAWLAENEAEVRDDQIEAYIAGSHQKEGALVEKQRQLNSRIMHLIKTEPADTLLQYGDLLSADKLEGLATQYPPGNLNNDLMQTYIRLALVKQVLRGIPSALEALNRHTRNYTLDDEAVCLAIQTYANQDTNDLEELCALINMHSHSVSGEPSDDVLMYDRDPEAIQKQAKDILEAIQPFGESLFHTTIESETVQTIPVEWGFLVSSQMLQTLKENHPTRTSDDTLIRAVMGCCQLFKAALFSDKQAEHDFRQGNVQQFMSDLICSGMADTELGEAAIQYALDLGINITQYPLLGDAAIEAITGREHTQPLIPSRRTFSMN